MTTSTATSFPTPIPFGRFRPGANLANAIITEKELRHTYFDGANLHDALIAEVDFTSSRAQGLNAQYSIWKQVTAKHFDIKGADLKCITIEDSHLEHIKAEGANLSEARFVGVKLIGANLRGADFSGAELYYVDFTSADLSGADLRGATLVHCKLDHTILRGANLALWKGNDSYEPVPATRFGRCDVRKAIWDGADITGVTFEQCQVDEYGLARAIDRNRRY